MTYEHGSVLALYPTSPGYAFAFLERRATLIDWGLRRMPGPHRERNAKTMADIEALLEKYQPDNVVIEDGVAPGSRRSHRIRRLHRAIIHGAQARLIEVEAHSRDEVRETFASVGAVSRYEIAQAVCREFPALAHRLPHRRKIWESERSVMGLFAAVALALTSYKESATP